MRIEGITAPLSIRVDDVRAALEAADNCQLRDLDLIRFVPRDRNK